METLSSREDTDVDRHEVVKETTACFEGHVAENNNVKDMMVMSVRDTDNELLNSLDPPTDGVQNGKSNVDGDPNHQLCTADNSSSSLRKGPEANPSSNLLSVNNAENDSVNKNLPSHSNALKTDDALKSKGRVGDEGPDGSLPSISASSSNDIGRSCMDDLLLMSSGTLDGSCVSSDTKATNTTPSKENLADDRNRTVTLAASSSNGSETAEDLDHKDDINVKFLSEADGNEPSVEANASSPCGHEAEGQSKPAEKTSDQEEHSLSAVDKDHGEGSGCNVGKVTVPPNSSNAAKVAEPDGTEVGNVSDKAVNVPANDSFVEAFGNDAITFDCRVCTNSFDTDADREKHEQGHKLPKVATYKCDMCSEKFSKTCLLKHHRETHFSGKSFKQWQCEVCSKEFGRKDHLNRHLRNIHLLRNKCKFCGTLFDNKASLDAHEKTHQGNTPNFQHTCENCGRHFTNSWNLQRHRMTHSRGTVFCNYCAESFEEKEKLREHILELHDGASPRIPQKSPGTDASEKVLSSAKQLLPNDAIPSLEQSKPSTKFECVGSVPFKCRYCSCDFKTDLDLRQHETTHSRRKTFPCMHCGAIFSQRGTLQIHKIEKHMEDESPDDDHKNDCKPRTDHDSPSNSFLCAYCGVSFSQIGDLRVHERDEHMVEEPPEDPDFSKVIEPESNDVSEAENENDAKKSVSVNDDKVSRRGGKRKGGRGVKSDSDFTRHKCRYCRSSFDTRSHLRRHEITHTRGKAFECEYCGATFSQMGTLKIHEMQSHLDQEVRAENKRKLSSSHVQPKPKVKMFYCDKCSEKFTSETERNKHVMNHPTCYLCDKRFSNDKGLQTHMHIHHSGNKFKCETCKKQFSQLKQLKRHQVFHKEDRPFKCGSCEGAYKHKWALQQHQATHSNYVCKCDQCGKRFRRKYSLQRHQAESHDKAVQEYDCLQCNESFQDEDDFHNHIIIQHAKVLYRCTNCQQTFENAAELTKHEANRSFCSQYLASQIPRDNDVYRCSDCRESFDDIISLGCHTCQVVEGVKKCGFCKESFESSERLKEHEQKVHKKEKKEDGKEDVHKCATCPLDFDTLQSLQAHEEMHKSKKQDKVTRDGQKSLQEDAAGQEKVQAADWAQPVESANSNDARTVTHCLTTEAGQESDLRRAESSAEEKESFSCELCELTFSSQSLLSTHENTHKIQDNDDGSQAVQTVVSYRCDKCDKSFARFHDCVDHEKGCTFVTDTVKRQEVEQAKGVFTCGYCATSFNSRVLLKKHLSLHMGDLVSTSSETIAMSDSERVSDEDQDEGFSLFRLTKHRASRGTLSSGEGGVLIGQESSAGASNKGSSKSLTASSFTTVRTPLGRSSRKRPAKDITPSGSNSKRLKSKSESASPVSPNSVTTTTRRGRNVVTPARFREQLMTMDDDVEEIDDTGDDGEEEGDGDDDDDEEEEEEDDEVGGRISIDDKEDGSLDDDDELVNEENEKSSKDIIESKRLDKSLESDGNKSGGAYECRLCSSTFSGKRALKKHGVVHRRKGKLQCRYCNAGFGHRQYLEDHERVHNGRLYRCKMCPATFKWMYNLKRHYDNKHGIQMNKAALMKDDANGDEGAYKQSSAQEVAGLEVIDSGVKSNNGDVQKEEGKQSDVESEKAKSPVHPSGIKSDVKIEEGAYTQSREQSMMGGHDSGVKANDGDVHKEIGKTFEVDVEKKKLPVHPSGTNSDQKIDEGAYTQIQEQIMVGGLGSGAKSDEGAVQKEEGKKSELESKKKKSPVHPSGTKSDGKIEEGAYTQSQEQSRVEGHVGDDFESDKIDAGDEGDGQSSQPEAMQMDTSRSSLEKDGVNKVNSEQVEKEASETDSRFSSDQDIEKDDQSLPKKKQVVYACELCPATFIGPKKLSHHQYVHTRNHEHKCSYCSASYKQEKHTQEHERLHTGDLYRCQVCNTTYVWGDDWERHMRTKHRVNARSLKGKLQEEQKIRSSFGKTKSVMLQLTKLDVGVVNITNETQEVGNADETKLVTFGHQSKEDALWKEVDGQFMCQFCPIAYNTRYQIVRHVDVHNRNFEFKCQYCSASYRDQRHQVDHERLHTGDVPRCDVCVKTFRWEDALRFHLQTSKHKKLAAQRLDKPDSDSDEEDEAGSDAIDIIDKSQSSDAQSEGSDSLDINGSRELRSSKERRKVGRKGEDLTNQKVQQKVVGGDRTKADSDQNGETELHIPSSCEGVVNAKDNTVERQTADNRKIDEGKYRQSSKLWEEDNGQFNCCLCPGTYSLQSSMVRHLKVHRRKCRWKCCYCSASYKEKRHMEEHEHLHTGDVPRCEVCDKTFRWKDTLRFHVKSSLHKRNSAQLSDTPVLDSDTEDEHESGSIESWEEIQELDAQGVGGASSNPAENDETKFNETSPKEEEKEKVPSLRTNGALTAAKLDQNNRTESHVPLSSEGVMDDKQTSGVEKQSADEGNKEEGKYKQSSKLWEEVDGHFNCCHCPSTYKIRYQILRHSDVHQRKCEFKCGYCNASYRAERHLLDHERLHTVGLYQCDMCDKTFKWGDTYRAHVKLMHSDVATNCGDSTIELPSEKTGRRLRKRNASPGRCYTGAQTNEESTPKQIESVSARKCRRLERNGYHDDSEIGAGGEEESESMEQSGGSCEKESKPDDVTHSPAQTLHRCADCPTTFHTLLALNSHVADHHDGALLSCEFCDEKFTAKLLLEEHESLHKEVKGKVRKFQCQDCDKRYYFKSNLQRHKISTHTETTTSYSCRICGKKYMSQEYMIVHEKSHSRERKYKCEHCDKSYIRRNHLTRHELAHHSSAPIGEPNQGVAVHQKLNNGERNHKCEFCDKTYMNRKHMKRHERTHKSMPEPIGKPSAEEMATVKTRLRKKSLTYTNIREEDVEMQNDKQDEVEVKDQETSVQEVDHEKHEETVKKHHHRRKVAQKVSRHARNRDLAQNFAHHRPKVKRRHRVQYQSTQDSAYQCAECREEFSRSCSLKVHVLRKHKGMKFICWPCSSGFTSKAELVLHNQKRHGKPQQAT